MQRSFYIATENVSWNTSNGSKGFRFETREPIPLFWNRRPELTEIHRQLSLGDGNGNRLGVLGPGGTGKTELVRMYAHEQSSYFGGNVVWLNAENSKSFKNSVQNLCSKLLPSLKSSSNLEPSLEAVWKKLSCQRWLLVLDNVGDEKILTLLPRSLLTGLRSWKPCVVLTSRRTTWDEAPVLQIQPLIPSERHNFIIEFLRIPMSEDVEVLGSKVGGLHTIGSPFGR